MHISLMLLAEQIVALELLQGDALDFSLENWSSYFEVANLRCQKIGSYHISHVPNMEKLIQSSLMASLRDGNDLESHLGSPSNSSDSSIDSCSYSCKCVNGFEFGKTWKKKTAQFENSKPNKATIKAALPFGFFSMFPRCFRPSWVLSKEPQPTTTLWQGTSASFRWKIWWSQQILSGVPPWLQDFPS